MHDYERIAILCENAELEEAMNQVTADPIDVRALGSMAEIAN